MKRLLLIITVVTLIMFAGCKKNDDAEKNDTIWVKVEMSFDSDGEGPKGTMYLFYLENVFVDNYKPTIIEKICYLSDVNGEYVLPIYSESFKASTDANTGKYINKSTAIAFWYESLSSSSVNSVPKYGDSRYGDYLIVIDLDNDSYTQTSKKVTLTKTNQELLLQKTFQRDKEIDYLKPYAYYEEW